MLELVHTKSLADYGKVVRLFARLPLIKAEGISLDYSDERYYGHSHSISFFVSTDLPELIHESLVDQITLPQGGLPFSLPVFATYPCNVHNLLDIRPYRNYRQLI